MEKKLVKKDIQQQEILLILRSGMYTVQTLCILMFIHSRYPFLTETLKASKTI